MNSDVKVTFSLELASQLSLSPFSQSGDLKEPLQAASTPREKTVTPFKTWFSGELAGTPLNYLLHIPDRAPEVASICGRTTAHRS